MPTQEDRGLERRRWIVRGLVQGVGFRPFVFRLAARHGLGGYVCNDAEGVVIEGEGSPHALAEFQDGLRLFAPPLAVIGSLDSEIVPPVGDTVFRILPSGGRTTVAAALIPPDVATCAACLFELRDPADRRHRYPFINCTNCGPRYTIVGALPYDRAETTMASFVLCPICRAEFEEPASRRYHAQPNACPVCGPRVELASPSGQACASEDPIRAAAQALTAGAIVAVKGIGGFHLACNAEDDAAVRRLRERKGRPDKPLAVMARDRDAAERLAILTDREIELLEDWRRPILLCLPRRPTSIAPEVFGSSRLLGLFLPYSPLHHLLLEAAEHPLVMTSGNRSEEPIARTNEEATLRLADIADLQLRHDREIRQTADDSIARVVRGHPILLRRSRGYVPQPLILPSGGRSVLALGADLKGTCAVTRDGMAFCSPYLGDLSHPAAADLLERTAEHLMRLLSVRPDVVVHDLHPDYASTRAAERYAARFGAERLAVQHHHAHALAVLAEHRSQGPALAVAFDGTGFGSDGTTWGGEFLRVDGLAYRRVAHFLPWPLPGGDRAAREPWRMALAALRQLAGADAETPPDDWRRLPCFSAAEASLVAAVWRLAGDSEGSPRTSSVGRLFDAAASILGLRQHLSFEGQAAAELEDAATESAATDAYPVRWAEAAVTREPCANPCWIVDPGPLFGALAGDALRGALPADCAARFHGALVAVVIEGARRVRESEGLDLVVLCGGVFQNRWLVERVIETLEADRFRVLFPAQVSPNDEGVALGQAWAGTLLRRNCPSVCP